MSRMRIARRCAVVGAVILAGLVAASAVPQRVTDDDVAALTQYGIVLPEERGVVAQRSEAAQIDFLRALERRVHGRVTGIEPIAPRRSREPRQVLDARSGVCFDRARVIEKAAKLAGFKTRREFLLYLPGGDRSAASVAKRFVEPGGPTHTVVEVQVGGHWIFLGTLTPVIGISDGGKLWSVHALSQLDPGTRKALLGREGWKEILDDTPFVTLRGLYSRNGQQYWPYPPFPNYAPGQIASLLTDPSDD